jgi:hypothetical protein
MQIPVLIPKEWRISKRALMAEEFRDGGRISRELHRLRELNRRNLRIWRLIIEKLERSEDVLQSKLHDPGILR